MRRALIAAFCALLLAPLGARAGNGAQDYSPAERLLFMTAQLKDVQPPAQLRYAFKKSGSLEEGFTDGVTVALSARADGGCCDAKGAFLSAARQQQTPDVPGARGNPVILYFLEHDVREMKRLTGGAENHFRQRIRMAVYQGAQVRDATFQYRGRAVQGQEVTFSPYLDDPNRPKYEKFVRKNYCFMLSRAVPGGVYGIRTEIPGDGKTDAQALVVEELFLEGAQLPFPGSTIAPDTRSSS
ncbi:MAG: hypothetical protein FWG56_12850 [Desulfovibrionaceae bacterium]|jgi:hypothetical protein|nr:hypothetical protein [Desulfovibrionaceae bacterium]